MGGGRGGGWVVGRLLLALLGAVVAGGIVWVVVRVGLEVADQTSSVIGGTAGVLGLAVAVYGLRERPGSAAGPVAGVGRGWVGAAAVHASLRPPAPQVPVRGREHELAVLDGLLRGGSGLAVLCGAGGLGKTTLAAEAADRARRAGRTVFWLRWQNSALLADNLTRAAQALGLTDTALQTAQRGEAPLVDVVWEHLEACAGWVIVVDNVDTPGRVGPGAEAVGAYRGWLRPGGTGGLLVVTSRDTTAATWGADARVLRLEPLDSVEAGAVLCDAAPGAGTVEEGRELGCASVVCRSR